MSSYSKMRRLVFSDKEQDALVEKLKRIGTFNFEELKQFSVEIMAILKAEFEDYQDERFVYDALEQVVREMDTRFHDQYDAYLRLHILPRLLTEIDRCLGQKSEWRIIPPKVKSKQET